MWIRAIGRRPSRARLARGLCYEFRGSSRGAKNSSRLRSRQRRIEPPMDADVFRFRRGGVPTYSLRSTAYSLRGPLQPFELWLRPRGRASLLAPKVCARRTELRRWIHRNRIRLLGRGGPTYSLQSPVYSLRGPSVMGCRPTQKRAAIKSLWLRPMGRAVGVAQGLGLGFAGAML